MDRTRFWSLSGSDDFHVLLERERPEKDNRGNRQLPGEAKVGYASSKVPVGRMVRWQREEDRVLGKSGEQNTLRGVQAYHALET